MMPATTPLDALGDALDSASRALLTISVSLMLACMITSVIVLACAALVGRLRRNRPSSDGHVHRPAHRGAER